MYHRAKTQRLNCYAFDLNNKNNKLAIEGQPNEYQTALHSRHPLVPAPSFIVLGAVKAGTTSLYNYLGQHPEIEMSDWNWPRYFHIADGPPDFESLAARYGEDHLADSEGRYSMMIPERIPREMQQYESLWKDNAKIRGEVSPTYIHDASVCASIASRAPDTKLLIVLRAPVERAYSHFVMDRRRGWESIEDFGEALDSEPDDADDFWWGRRHYIRHGLYAESVKQYLQTFPRDQVRIMFYDDLVSNSALYLKRIFEFLEVDPSFVVDTSKRHNKGLVRNNTMLTRLLYANFPGREWLKKRISDQARTVVSKTLTKTTHSAASPLTADLRARLVSRFRDDVRELESLVDRDLSSWVR